MDTRGLISLTAEYERVAKLAASSLNHFVGHDWAIYHNKTEKELARKTTVRLDSSLSEHKEVHKFFPSEMPKHMHEKCIELISTELDVAETKKPGEQENLLDDLIYSKFVSCNVYEVQKEKLSFDFHSYWLKTLNKVRAKTAITESNGNSQPHSIYFFHAALLIEGLSDSWDLSIREQEAAAKPQDSPQDWQGRRGVIHDMIAETREAIGLASSRELFRQIAYFGSGELSHFDVGFLAFSLLPSLKAVPIGTTEHAINIVGKVLHERPDLYLHPYHSFRRDHAIATNIEEVSSALLLASLDYGSKTGQIKKIEENVIGSLQAMLQRIDTRKILDGSGSVRGWPQQSHPNEPEPWPTLAVLEYSMLAIKFLRMAILYSLKEEYGFYLEITVNNTRSIDEYRESPFGIHEVLSTHYTNRETDPWSSAILFGPPGTGKTSLVKALAKELRWKFILITPADLAQDGPDGIVKRARYLLECLGEVDEAVILFDEFDPFMLARNEGNSGTWSSLITNCMLPLLGNLRDSQRGLFFVATNLVSELDKAAVREGRFDAILPVWPLSLAQRRVLLTKFFPKANKTDIAVAASSTKWATFVELKSRMKAIDETLVPSAMHSAETFTKDLEMARPKVADTYN